MKWVELPASPKSRAIKPEPKPARNSTPKASVETNHEEPSRSIAYPVGSVDSCRPGCDWLVGRLIYQRTSVTRIRYPYRIAEFRSSLSLFLAFRPGTAALRRLASGTDIEHVSLGYHFKNATRSALLYRQHKQQWIWSCLYGDFAQ